MHLRSDWNDSCIKKVDPWRWFLSEVACRDCAASCGWTNLPMWQRHIVRKLGGWSRWSFANIKHNMHKHIQHQEVQCNSVSLSGRPGWRLIHDEINITAAGCSVPIIDAWTGNWGNQDSHMDTSNSAELFSGWQNHNKITWSQFQRFNHRSNYSVLPKDTTRGTEDWPINL